MKSILRAAFFAALLGTASTMAMTPACAADKLTREVQNDLATAQKAMQANDFATALAKIKDAQGVSDRSAYDDYMINIFLAQVYIQQKDYTSATAPLEAAADSPAIPDDQKKATYSNAFQLAVAAQHYQKAVNYGQQLQAMNALDAKTTSLLALSYYEVKDTAHALQAAQASIELSKAAGTPPDENALKIVENNQAQQHDTAGFQASLEAQAVSYNSPDAWGRLIDLGLQGKNVKDADALYLLRLKFLMPDSMRSEDYTSLGSVAQSQSYSTEAYDVYEKGIASGKVTAAQIGPAYAKARNDANIDRGGLNQIAASAEKSKTGQQDIKLAEDYWGYGRFADAEVAARRAISKGGLKDPSEGPLVLGMILTVEGKYDDAIQALSQVSGPASRMNTAHLWSLYAQVQKKAKGTTAAH